MPRKRRNRSAPLPSLAGRRGLSVTKSAENGSIQPILRDISEDMLGLIEEYKRIKTENERNTWFLADIAQEAAHKDGLFVLSRMADESYGTLKVYSYIAGQFPKDIRIMFPNLLFSHFKLVVAKPDRMVWLEKADSERWTVYKLQKELETPDILDQVSELLGIQDGQMSEIQVPYQYIDIDRISVDSLSIEMTVDALNSVLSEGRLGQLSLLEVLNILFMGIGRIEYDQIENRFLKV